MLRNMTDVQNTTEKLAYDVNEVSAMTTLSKSFLRNEIRKGNLLAVRPGNSRRVLIMKDDLTAYLEKGSKGRSED